MRAGTSVAGVVERCLAHQRHLVTTSYVQPAMRALDAEAKARGVILLNELGLDPGIDHMSAMRVIHGVRRAGGRVTSFRSYCGGLVARLRVDAGDRVNADVQALAPTAEALAGADSQAFVDTLPGGFESAEGSTPGSDTDRDGRRRRRRGGRGRGRGEGTEAQAGTGCMAALDAERYLDALA